MAKFSLLQKLTRRPVQAALDGSAAFFVVLSQAEGQAGPVRVAGIELPGLDADTGRIVPLPGWIWTHAARGRVTLAVGSAELRLDRQMLIRWVKDLLALPVAERRTHAVVSALEHVHYGAFWPDLPQDAQRWLAGQATDLGLAHVVPPEIGPEIEPEAAPEAAAPSRAEPAPPDPVQALLRRFGRAVRAAGDGPSAFLLADILYETDLTLPQRLDAVRELTPHFCRIDQIEHLYRHILPQDGPAAVMPEPGQDWADSLTLPARYLSEDFDRVLEILQRAGAEPQNWISTPAVGWVLRRLVWQTAPFVPFHLFEGMLQAGLAICQGRAQIGRGGVHCDALRGAAVAMLQRRWLCSDRLQADMDVALAEAFGASAAFWAALDREGVPLSSALAQARARFQAVQGGAALADAPASGSADDIAGLRRIGQELSGLPLALTDLPGMEPPDVLRQCAAPLQGPLDPAILPDLGRAVRQSYYGLPQSPLAQVQRQVMHLARRALDGETPDLPRLTAGLTRLSGLATGGLGLGLTLAIVEDFLTRDNAQQAEGLARDMAPVFARVVRNAGDALSDAPAVTTAARGAQARAGGLAAVRHLLDLLPEPIWGGPALPDGPWAGSGGLYDTVVAVYSCRAHLDTRIPALRATWLTDLQRLGIPYVIVVGGDHTALDGDVLTVAAGDDYEDLPAKTLALIDWVRDCTGAGHLLKVDDDCYLDVQAYFDDPTYRRHDYYGRRLEKRGPLVERTWHQARSRTPHARQSFEKLPRDAIYADGGTGYALTRRAMVAIGQQLATAEGQALALSAWSEDKLVGALLGQAGIEPSEMSYFTAVERQAASSETEVASAPVPPQPVPPQPVPQWVSGFRPNGMGVTKLVHLDAGGDLMQVHQARTDPRPRPLRIWPTHMPPRLGFNSGALHLLSPEARLRAVADAPVAVVCVLRNEAQMLPHFLRHYRALGVGGFLIADNGSDDGTLAYLMDQPDVALFTADTEFREMDQGTDWKIALMAHYRMNRWSVVADADELLLYPGYQDTALEDWLQAACGPDKDAVMVRMLDLYPQGPLAEASLDADDLFAMAGFTDRRPFLAESLSAGPYENARTWTSGVRHRLMPEARPDLFVAQKVPVLRYRPWMQLSTSLHYATDVQLCPQPLLFAHFKYHAGFAAKAQREILRGQYYNGAEEYRGYLQMVAAGQDRLYDPAHSVPWRNCGPVRALLGPEA